MEVLKAEVIEVLHGTSAFGPTLLNDLIERSEGKITRLKQELQTTDVACVRCIAGWSRLCETRKALLSADVTDILNLTFPQQQELAALLIDRVEIGRGNAVRLHWSFGGTACLGSVGGA